MIQLKNVSLTRGNKDLLNQVTATVFNGQKIGLIGHNGCGKTSLFLCMLKQIEPSSGALEYHPDLRIAYVSQETTELECSALEFVMQGDSTLTTLLAQIKQAESDEDYDNLAEYHAQFAELDGYSANSRAAQLLHYLGFDEQEQSQPVSAFSGGWRVRLNLAKALYAPSDILLLDEPTNHLDLNTIVWLEKWLQNYAGTLIVISHDRFFLDHIIRHVWHIHQQKVDVYTGNYSQFEDQYSQKIVIQQATYEKQQTQIKSMMQFVNRFGAKASKARQAQSRLKMIEKIDTVEAVQRTSPIRFSFFEPAACQNPLMNLDHVDLGYGDKIILKNVVLQIYRGDRIGLLGKNGAGKSTLIKAMMGEVLPMRGEIITANKLTIGYFAQHQLEYFDPTESAYAHLQEIAKGETEQKLRQFLGGFGFPGDKVFDPIGLFSGGEKSRLALALIIWQRPALLLLDEPTNHLDLETRMALMLALQQFAGSVLLVSHDRYLMNSISDSLLLIEAGNVSEFTGTLDEYETYILSSKSKKETPAPTSAKTSVSYEQNKRNNSRIAQIERQLEKLNTQIKEIEVQLARTDLYQNEQYDEYRKILAQKEECTRKIQQLETEWISLQSV